MSYARFVCWRQERLDAVMDTEALQPSRATFLATHHPIRMYRASDIAGGTKTDYDERTFLSDFLKPPEFAFAAVLGEAGTGKSHLIRWLELSIPNSRRRRVLLIPKVGTNLKSIIGRILEGMEGQKFDDYRRRLQEGTQAITDAEARERLLANLAIAVGPNQVRDRELDETEKYLVRRLPDLLLDGVFRRHLLRDGGRLHELVTHILGRMDRVERVDKPREFTLEDLPLNVTDFQNAGASARQLYSLLLNEDDIVTATLRWLNEHLGIAIRQLLNLSGENLLELMLDVREALAEQRVELIILIEDFAKLQGIDRQLLEALLVRTHQEGRKPLCALRTALAVTTGYFQRLEDTVKMRITFRVEMDVSSAEAGGIITQENLEQFSARYLNAARLPAQELEQWVTVTEDDPAEPLPNACVPCPYREVCHASFGEQNGVGLYPFNGTSLSRMASRASEGTGAFNPRLLINRVLFDTLDKYTGSLRGGQFPPPALLQQFGRARLPAAVTAEIRRRDPQQWERRQVLLDLWTSGSRVVDLPAGVHEAFDIPTLGAEVERLDERALTVGTSSSRHLAGGTTQAPTSVAAALPDKLVRQLQELDEWHNRRILEPSQPTSQALRELVFRAVVEHINWDAELLHKGSFAGGARCLLQQRYISFSNVDQRERGGSFKLTVPVQPSDLNEAALALQGLLQYDHHKNWGFPDGASLRRVYVRQLEKWCAAVLSEVERPTVSGAPWDPVPTLVRLLAIGARMHDHPATADPTIVDFVAGVFDEWKKSSDGAGRTQAWKDLAGMFRQRRTDLQEMLVARIPCTKGGRATAQIVDAVRLMKPLREVRDSWMVGTDIPEDLPRDLAFLGEMKRRVDATLRDAALAEQQRIATWADEMAAAIGDTGRDDLIKAAEDLVIRAGDAGLAAGNRAAVQTAIQDFPSRQAIKALRESTARLCESNDFATVLAEVSRDRGEAMSAITTFVNCLTQFMDATEQRVQSRLRELEASGAGTLDVAEQQLDRSLATMIEQMESLAGVATCS
jgi:hypothetical protein